MAPFPCSHGIQSFEFEVLGEFDERIRLLIELKDMPLFELPFGEVRSSPEALSHSFSPVKVPEEVTQKDSIYFVFALGEEFLGE